MSPRRAREASAARRRRHPGAAAFGFTVRRQALRHVRRLASALLASLLAAACAGDGSAPGGTVDPALRPPPIAPGEAPRPATAAAPLPRTGGPGIVLPAPQAPGFLAAAAGSRGTLVRVGARDVTTADLGEHVRRWHPDVAAAALERIVEGLVVAGEAAREGVSVAEADVLAAAERAATDRLREIRLEYGVAEDPERLLRERFGRTRADLVADAAGAIRTTFLRDRLVRLSQFRSDAVEIRVLVFATRDEAAAAVERLREGADMTILARRMSADPPAAPPPLRRDDVPDAALRKLLFEAEAGTVTDPVPYDTGDADRRGGGTAWQVFKVLRVRRATSEPWAALAPQIERGLLDAPVEQAELRRWEAEAYVRQGVRVVPPSGPAAAPPGVSVPSGESQGRRTDR